MSRRVDLPGSRALEDWGGLLRRDRLARRRLARRAGLTGLGCAVLLLPIVAPPAPRLVWNASASAPVGLYRVSPGTPVHAGDMVVAWPPAPARALAARRHYLPSGVPLVKRVTAAPGDRVCGVGPDLVINGRIVARRAARDREGRPMPTWSGCRLLYDGQYLLLMAGVPYSFDGRYFGVTDAADIIGPARLLWRR